jgi:putative SOS response-associated peptidase YedK
MKDPPDGIVPRTFALVTSHASADMVGLREHMSPILDQADWATWLGEVDGDRAAPVHPASDGALAGRGDAQG